MSKPKPAPLPSGTVVGGYQIVKKLAAGGFGVVYLAEDDKQPARARQWYERHGRRADDGYGSGEHDVRSA